MKKRLFPFVIGLAALAVSGSAAFYSVFGLSKLFAGASMQVIIMAGSLEFAKLVCASLLYQYWGTINKWLRTYLSVAVFVLMVITSGGIYGFLSGAYQETATKSEFLDKSLAVLKQKQVRFEENKTDLTLEKTQLNTTISDLRTSLSNPTQVSYYSEDAGQVITTSSTSARKALQKELALTIADRDTINVKLEAVQDSILSLDTQLLDLEIGNEEQRELGPLKYLAETTGKEMGTVVNWFLLLIVFVFDPLAIAMVVAANFAFAQIKGDGMRVVTNKDDIKDIPDGEEFIYSSEPAMDFDEQVKASCPPGLEFDTPYTLDEIKEKWTDAEEKEEKESDEMKEAVEEFWEDDVDMTDSQINKVELFEVFGESKDENVYVEKADKKNKDKKNKDKQRPKRIG